MIYDWSRAGPPGKLNNKDLQVDQTELVLTEVTRVDMLLGILSSRGLEKWVTGLQLSTFWFLMSIFNDSTI